MEFGWGSPIGLGCLFFGLGMLMIGIGIMAWGASHDEKKTG
jgi:hypothetical protein